MNNYKVIGESRMSGAIGIFEQFIEHETAESSKEVYNKVRESLHSKNREHVLIKSIQISNDDGTWTLVEPAAYLYS